MTDIVKSIATVFRPQLLKGRHDFSSDTFKFALYSNGPVNGATRSYAGSLSDGAVELVEQGYTAGGFTLVSSVNDRGEVIVPDLAVSNLRAAGIPVAGGLVYNSSLTGDNAVASIHLRNSLIDGPVVFHFGKYPFLKI